MRTSVGTFRKYDTAEGYPIMVSIGAKDRLALGGKTIELLQDNVYHAVFKHAHQHTVSLSLALKQ